MTTTWWHYTALCRLLLFDKHDFLGPIKLLFFLTGLQNQKTEANLSIKARSGEEKPPGCIFRKDSIVSQVSYLEWKLEGRSLKDKKFSRCGGFISARCLIQSEKKWVPKWAQTEPRGTPGREGRQDEAQLRESNIKTVTDDDWTKITITFGGLRKKNLSV